MLLAVVLYRVNWFALGMLMTRMDTSYLLLVLPLFLLPIWLKSVRWSYILKIQNIWLPARTSFQYYAAAIFWGIITPGRIGEMVKIFYLTERGINTGRASLSVILDRVLDIALLFLLTLMGISFTFRKPNWLFITLVAVGLIWLLLYGMRRSPIVISAWQRLSSYLPEKGRQTMANYLEQLKADTGKFSLAKIFLMSAFSAVIWLTYAVPFLLLGSSMELEIPLPFLFTGVLAAAFIAMLPISIAGIGTREAFLIYYFGLAGVLPEKSLLFSFMFIYMYCFNLLFGFMIQSGTTLKIPRRGIAKSKSTIGS